MVAIILTSTYIVEFAKGDYSIRMEEIHAISVTAHRGASTAYPENTMSAFQGPWSRELTGLSWMFSRARMDISLFHTIRISRELQGWIRMPGN